MKNRILNGRLGSGRVSPGVVFVIVAILVGFDQYTKSLIRKSMALGDGYNVIPGFCDLVYIQNTGAAFGFLSHVDSVWVHRGFSIFTVMALVVILFLYKTLATTEWQSRTALVMIGSGALGNFIDRIRLGSVTDFLLFYIGQYQWPAFNVADSLITSGVALLAYSLMFSSTRLDSR